MKTVAIKDASVHQQVKMICVRERISLVDAVIEALLMFIKKHSQTK